MSTSCLVVAGGEQRRLVEDVGEVGTGEAGGTPGDDREVDVGGDRLALGVDGEDALAALEVGTVDHDLAVEAAGTQQRRVEDVGPVGGGDQDDAGLGVEAVHLDQQLVQGLLALVVSTAEAGAAVAADRVDLVDEDDGGCVGLGLLEQVADPAGADTDEHLDEVGSGDRVERHAGLAGDGAGEQRLTGTGRAVEQHALGDLGADRLELRGVREELLDLVELLDRLVGAGDVGERGLRGVLADQLGLGLAEVHHPVAAALHRVHEEQQQADHQQDRQEIQRQGQQHIAVVDADGVIDVLGIQRIGERQGLLGGEGRAALPAVLHRDLDLLLAVLDRGAR